MASRTSAHGRKVERRSVERDGGNTIVARCSHQKEWREKCLTRPAASLAGWLAGRAKPLQNSRSGENEARAGARGRQLTRHSAPVPQLYWKCQLGKPLWLRGALPSCGGRKFVASLDLSTDQNGWKGTFTEDTAPRLQASATRAQWPMWWFKPGGSSQIANGKCGKCVFGSSINLTSFPEGGSWRL